MRRAASILKFAAFSLALTLVLCPGQGMAQDMTTKRFDITAFGGWRWGGSATIQETELFLQASECLGGAVDLSVYESWEGIVFLEAWFSQQRATVEARLSSTEPKEERGKVDIRYYMGGIGYEWKLPKANPYFAFIMGATEFSPTEAAAGVTTPEGNTRFAWGFAGGLKYKLGPQVGIRADVRGYGTQTDLVETGWGCGYYDCGVVSYEKTIWQGDATAGVFIAF
jgi:hypothetical protein